MAWVVLRCTKQEDITPAIAICLELLLLDQAKDITLKDMRARHKGPPQQHRTKAHTNNDESDDNALDPFAPRRLRLLAAFAASLATALLEVSKYIVAWIDIKVG